MRCRLGDQVGSKMPRAGQRLPLPTIFSLLDTPAFGGAEQYMFSFLNALNESGYPIVLATNNQQVKAEFEKRLAATSARTAQFSIIPAPYRLDAIGNWKGLFKYFVNAPFAIGWLVWTLAKLQKSVICLIPGFSDRLTFSPFIKLFHLPLIWIEFGPLEPVFKKTWGFPRILYFLARPFVDHVITISEWGKVSTLSAGKISSEKVSIISPGIQIFSDKELAKFRQNGQKEKVKLSIHADLPLIGYVGRLASENQVDVLIEAFALVKNAQLLIIGDGPERTLYESLVRKLGLQDHVHFTGFVDEKTKFNLLSTCDIFVYARTWALDGFGISTAEAMSLGLPVVTPNFGPQKELIENRVSGLHFAPNNSQDLANKISYLLSHPADRAKIGVAARKKVAQFEDKKQFEKMLRLIKKFQ